MLDAMPAGIDIDISLTLPVLHLKGFSGLVRRRLTFFATCNRIATKSRNPVYRGRLQQR